MGENADLSQFFFDRVPVISSFPGGPYGSHGQAPSQGGAQEEKSEKKIGFLKFSKKSHFDLKRPENLAEVFILVFCAHIGSFSIP